MIVAGVIPVVVFDEGSARLRPESYVPLDSIADILQADTTIRVEVGAHTDNSTTAAAAQHLTSLQADAVRTYLVTKGVKFQQVVPQGYGSTVPITPDTSPIMGRTPVEGLFVSGGWGTGGFKAIPAGGETMAWTLANGEPHAMIRGFGLDRFAAGRLVDEGAASGVAH